MDASEVAHYAHMAAVLEASCEKPGNVTPTHSFDDLAYADFVSAAAALEPYVKEAAELGEHADIGRLIYEATPSDKNVNFGIIMLFMPIAASHGKSTKKIIRGLGTDDTKNIIRAIQKGRLGSMELSDPRLDKYDVLGKRILKIVDEEDMTPLDLMRLSAPHDTIAAEWVGDYPICRTISEQIDFDDSTILHNYLKTLSRYPDTLIIRKAGADEAQKVSAVAEDVLCGRTSNRDFDDYLRSQGNRLNPGTTADLIACGLFLRLLNY